MQELNTLSKQCMEVCVCIPAYAHTYNYIYFHVELCVYIYIYMRLKTVYTDVSNLICYGMYIVTFSLCMQLRTLVVRKLASTTCHLSNSVLVPFDDWHSSFRTISYYPTTLHGKELRVHSYVYMVHFAFDLQVTFISTVKSVQPICPTTKCEFFLFLPLNLLASLYGMWAFSFPTRNWTHIPCISNMES